MNLKTICLTVLAAGVALPAFAEGRGGGHGRSHHDSRYEDRYGDSQWATVVSATPVYRDVRVNQPRQECWDEPVRYRESRGGDETGGAILGAIVGGVVGHQFGRGKGNTAATAIGAVIGSQVGRNMASEGHRDVSRTVYEERCRTFDDVSYEQRIDGYDVAYRYGGRVYHTTMPYDPGNRIRVSVAVQPVR